MKALRAPLSALAWLVVAVLVALGGAGIVAAMNHVPGTEARAEMTWDGDSETGPALDTATDQLQVLSDEVDALGSTARQALAAVVSGDTAMVNDTIAAGTLRLATVQQVAASLEASVGAIPSVGEDGALRLSPELQARYA